MNRRDAVVVTAIVTVLAAVVLTGTIGSASEPASLPGNSVASDRFGFSVRLPAGWHRSTRRLVPDLLDPREILSVGTFAMPAGGGGNCDSEPVAAIRRMRPGDALINLKEVEENGAMRRRVRSGVFPPDRTQALGEIRLRRSPMPAGERAPTARTVWYGKLTFRAAGR